MRKLFRKLFLIAASVLVTAAMSPAAETIRSPDGKFGVEVGKDISMVDAGGHKVMLLNPSTQGIENVDVIWSEDSSRVVFAVNYRRGSGVFAAWRQGLSWHKTLELDTDLAELGRDIKEKAGLDIVSENRSLGPWLSEDSLLVNGLMKFSGGRELSYQYILELTPSPGRLDRGGFEPGALVGRGYKIL